MTSTARYTKTKDVRISCVNVKLSLFITILGLFCKQHEKIRYHKTTQKQHLICLYSTWGGGEQNGGKHFFSIFFVPHVDQQVTERVILSCKCD